MFTGVCLSTGGGGGAIPACIAGGIPACLAAGLQGGGALSQHALQMVSQHALQQVSKGGGVSRPTPKGEVEGDLVQAHSQGGNWGGSGPGPQPRGKLRGIWSRPTANGEVLRGIWSRGCLVWGVCLLQGGSWSRGVPALCGGCLVETSPDGYCCRRYVSYWNAFFYFYLNGHLFYGQNVMHTNWPKKTGSNLLCVALFSQYFKLLEKDLFARQN